VHGRADLAAFATSLFGPIDGARSLGRPGDSAYFVLESGGAYVQALARWDGSNIRMEAASETSVPALAEVLTPEKRQRLSELGFQAPGPGPNYWRDVEVGGSGELLAAGALAATVLWDVFDVGDAAAVEVKVNIPPARPLGFRDEPGAAPTPGGGYVIGGLRPPRSQGKS